MKAALLCNGPSRVSYQADPAYQFVLGCNVPWTDVNATVILDAEVIEKWNKSRSLINVPVYTSESAHKKAMMLDKIFFKDKFIKNVYCAPNYHSSGHVAAEVLIELGYTEIDIYGCDSWFSMVGDSYTRTVVPHTSPNMDLRMPDRIKGWRIRWNSLIDSNPNVKLNFIK